MKSNLSLQFLNVSMSTNSQVGFKNSARMFSIGEESRSVICRRSGVHKVIFSETKISLHGRNSYNIC